MNPFSNLIAANWVVERCANVCFATVCSRFFFSISAQSVSCQKKWKKKTRHEWFTWVPLRMLIHKTVSQTTVMSPEIFSCSIRYQYYSWVIWASRRFDIVTVDAELSHMKPLLSSNIDEPWIFLPWRLHELAVDELIVPNRNVWAISLHVWIQLSISGRFICCRIFTYKSVLNVDSNNLINDHTTWRRKSLVDCNETPSTSAMCRIELHFETIQVESEWIVSLTFAHRQVI